MKYLSDALLLETYYKARELDLSEDFISLIKQEINRRSHLNNDQITS
ncbi:sporulation histidine kinase inhibitor Sda [Evansella sp. AB-P1]|nr:sporulation histidine kinase inhibitor Sda [Evansella sp. AB-P1]MDG5786510.1 sporulation histidine kinase inhibitor Sda [Evansella sp. AB-P1]